MEEIRSVAGPVIQRYNDKIEEERQARLKIEEEAAAKKRAEAEAKKKADEEAKAAADAAARIKKPEQKDTEMQDAETVQGEVEESK